MVSRREGVTDEMASDHMKHGFLATLDLIRRIRADRAHARPH
jgi:hypothetical protein